MGIIKCHQAIIDLKSKVGVGSTFRMIIPAKAHRETSLPLEITEPRTSGRGETILIADDEENVRKVASRVLEMHGYRTMIAVDGSEALALYAQHSSEINVVLTDITMPHVDGITLIRALQHLHCSAPIIASTGLGEAIRSAELKLLGITVILEKPYSAEVLLHAIENALKAAG